MKALIRREFQTSRCNEIKARTKEKQWAVAITDIADWPRIEAVAEFRLRTGHDCLAKHLHRLGVYTQPTCHLHDEEILEIVEESKVFAIRNQHLYTHTLVNSNMAEGVEKLARLVTRLEQQPGWIPAGWAYEMSLPKSFEKNGNGTYHLPGLSAISSSEIPGLPNDTQSVLGRGASSVLSTASPESAFRLARPPSVCSSLQIKGVAAVKSGYGTGSGHRRYEKRAQRPETPLTPVSLAQSSEGAPSTQTGSESFPPEQKFAPKSSEKMQQSVRPNLRMPLANETPRILNQSNSAQIRTKANAPVKAVQGTGAATKATEDDDAISSTSSEED
ncbi:unnamed protein product [Rodentolepis nana]|uniref:Ras-associating domain-containing protein n=1 Tax=Rodentolepis nana TaxID=102285 RepID=A0A0R3TZ64_RODNA|nr:unnamed protein product [Rodentolepis nana]